MFFLASYQCSILVSGKKEALSSTGSRIVMSTYLSAKPKLILRPHGEIDAPGVVADCAGSRSSFTIIQKKYNSQYVLSFDESSQMRRGKGYPEL